MTEAQQDSTLSAVFAVPGGRVALEAHAPLPEGKTTLTALLPIIQNLEDDFVGQIGELAREAGQPISCRAGCGACCRQMVPLSLFEAEALTAWMRTLPEERLAELQMRFHRGLSALRDAGVLEKMLSEEWMLEEGLAVQLAIDYFKAGVACPFLEDESCSIHPIRPLSCREHLVTSPAEFCSEPWTDRVAGVRLPLKLSRALFAFGQDLEQSPRGWIPLVFLLAWYKSGAKPGDHVAGNGEEIFKRFLEQVAAAASKSSQD